MSPVADFFPVVAQPAFNDLTILIDKDVITVRIFRYPVDIRVARSEPARINVSGHEDLHSAVLANRKELFPIHIIHRPIRCTAT